MERGKKKYPMWLIKEVNQLIYNAAQSYGVPIGPLIKSGRGVKGFENIRIALANKIRRKYVQYGRYARDIQFAPYSYCPDWKSISLNSTAELLGLHYTSLVNWVSNGKIDSSDKLLERAKPASIDTQLASGNGDTG